MKSGVPPALAPFLPRQPRPIVLVGAGGIVRDAHLPAYHKCGFPLAGVYDVNPAQAADLAARFQLSRTFASLPQAAAEAPAAVFDVAVPASALPDVLSQLPDGSAALLQKPMGEDLAQARQILELCRRKGLTAAVNFQLRFAPPVLTVRSLIASGAIGDLVSLDVRVTVETPWHRWPFMQKLPQFEIPYHSIHYLDLFRSFLGEPRRVHAHAFASPDLAGCGSTIVLDYGERAQAVVSTNHGHRFGLRHQESYLKWEGTAGALKAQLGLLMNYPKGEPDFLERWERPDDLAASPVWSSVPVEGSWFPDGFIGTMGSLQRHVNGEDPCLPTSVEDAFLTMGVVDAAIRSHRAGGMTPATA